MAITAMNEIIELLSLYHSLTAVQTASLSVVSDELIRVNERLNLTALKTCEEIALLHFYDSLAVEKAAGFKGMRVLDVGCGGGFPAFPIAAVLEPEELTALDSTQKKLNFIEQTAKTAGISNIHTLFGRAEELGAGGPHREAYDIVVARGVARMNILCEWCLPFVKPGGMFIAMKGQKGREESETATHAVKTLGGRTAGIIEYDIPLLGRTHCLITVEKISATPPEYPRQNSKIMKNPL